MEDFVTFEIAKKLKEKGFPQRTFSKYDMIGPCYIEDGRFYEKGCITEVERAYTALTISQVLKWLREEKKLFIEIYMYYNTYMWEVYNTEIYNSDLTQKSEGYSARKYASYELAALAGIEYVLDSLI